MKRLLFTLGVFISVVCLQLFISPSSALASSNFAGVKVIVKTDTGTLIDNVSVSLSSDDSDTYTGGGYTRQCKSSSTANYGGAFVNLNYSPDHYYRTLSNFRTGETYNYGDSYPNGHGTVYFGNGVNTTGNGGGMGFGFACSCNPLKVTIKVPSGYYWDANNNNVLDLGEKYSGQSIIFTQSGLANDHMYTYTYAKFRRSDRKDVSIQADVPNNDYAKASGPLYPSQNVLPLFRTKVSVSNDTSTKVASAVYFRKLCDPASLNQSGKDDCDWYYFGSTNQSNINIDGVSREAWPVWGSFGTEQKTGNFNTVGLNPAINSSIHPTGASAGTAQDAWFDATLKNNAGNNISLVLDPGDYEWSAIGYAIDCVGCSNGGNSEYSYPTTKFSVVEASKPFCSLTKGSPSSGQVPFSTSFTAYNFPNGTTFNWKDNGTSTATGTVTSQTLTFTNGTPSTRSVSLAATVAGTITNYDCGDVNVTIPSSQPGFSCNVNPVTGETPLAVLVQITNKNKVKAPYNYIMDFDRHSGTKIAQATEGGLVNLLWYIYKEANTYSIRAEATSTVDGSIVQELCDPPSVTVSNPGGGTTHVVR